MAQLPPKIPSMTQNWPNSFPHQKMASMASFMPSTTTQQHHQHQQQQPCWVDEFLDFTSTRRGAHRRSASDSIAFLESPLAEECRISNSATANAAAMMHGFDRLDDDQLMSMFSDDMSLAAVPPTLSSSNPSTPSSDQNSNNDDKPMSLDNGGHNHHHQPQPKSEPGEVESPCEGDAHATLAASAAAGSSGDTIIDPKRVKRILANRQSAQRSRVRKLQYISELERSVTTLQSEVSALSPRVAFLDHQRLILNVDNSALKQRIAALAQDKIFKDAHQEALKKEIERLRQVYHQQSLKNKMGNQNAPSSTPPPQNSDAVGCTDKA
ncbi:Basic-leucine zipper transcription factor [Trema orientale]|uniref:Basic-leucine zipper transcription factor n=1 Tax=Trema orientale TaxID=63057 RepID=A0A2P5F4X2_TREOI|nr:Basic-leucine zipper transcription factor [Trema orientale]